VKTADGSVDQGVRAAAKAEDPIVVHDALEALIQSGRATEADRIYAHEAVSGRDDGTAEHAFVRAALAGRLAQARGLSALALLHEAEQWARTSVERDPDYRRGAARRLLGTLYVLAGPHTRHGDSETGLSMLEELAARWPEDAVNHLRVGEAYVALGDPEGGRDALCRARAGRSMLTPEESSLLDRLVADAGGEEALACDAPP
jgi:hypothetical protein